MSDKRIRGILIFTRQINEGKKETMISKHRQKIENNFK